MWPSSVVLFERDDTSTGTAYANNTVCNTRSSRSRRTLGQLHVVEFCDAAP